MWLQESLGANLCFHKWRLPIPPEHDVPQIYAPEIPIFYLPSLTVLT